MKLGLGVETLRFLLPADVLPGEDDTPLKVPIGRAPDLFGCVDQLVTKPLLACRFAKSDASKFEIFTGESEVTLESVLLRPQADDGGTVCIDESSEFVWWNSDGIDRELCQKLHGNLPTSAGAIADALAEEISRLRRSEVSERLGGQEASTITTTCRWSQDDDGRSGTLIV